MNVQFYRALSARVFSTASALVSGMVSLWLFKRYFTPDTYGVILVAVQIMAYLSLLDGGFRTTVNRNLLAETSADERVRMVGFSQTFYSYLSVIMLGVAVLLMLIYCLFPSARHAQAPLFFVALGLSGAIALIGNTQLGLLVGLGAQAECFCLNGISSWATAGALAIALHCGAGVWAFPLSNLAAFAAVYPLTWWLIQRRIPGFKLFTFAAGSDFWSLFHKLKIDAWACFRSQVSIMLLFTLDVVIIGLICSAEEAAIYGVLSRMFTIVRNFLQTMGEVGWPLIAQRTHASDRFMIFLPRVNAWVYGSVMGAVSVTLGPFLVWFMGKSWAPSPILVYLLAARFLIIGASSPACYFLIGLGEFKTIARLIEREVVVAVILGTALGYFYHTTGVAVGFLLATAVGTFLPLFWAYARTAKLPVRGVVLQPWWRAGLAMAVSLCVAGYLTRLLGDNGGIIAVGLLSAGVPLSCVAILLLHSRRSRRDLLEFI